MVSKSSLAHRHEAVASLKDRLSVEGRIIEGVALDHQLLVVAVAVAIARSVVVGPGNGATELLHLAHIADHLLVRHAVVVVGKEARLLIVVRTEIVGSSRAVEAVDHEHRLGCRG